MNRIVLLVTVETEPFDYNNYGRNASADRPYGEQPPLDPPTADAVRSEIQSNLESVWPSARIEVREAVTEARYHTGECVKRHTL